MDCLVFSLELSGHSGFKIKCTVQTPTLSGIAELRALRYNRMNITEVIHQDITFNVPFVQVCHSLVWGIMAYSNVYYRWEERLNFKESLNCAVMQG